MDRKLLDYLPLVLREVLEFQAVNTANEPEIVLAWEGLERVLANQFLEEADSEGLSVWERELKLVPKDTDSLEDRRIRIKSMWMMERPYTLPWLRQWLDGLCGPGNHQESTADYTLNIQLDAQKQENITAKIYEIFSMLDRVCPANMWYVLDAELSGGHTVRHGLHGGTYMESGGNDAIRAGLDHRVGLTGCMLLEFYGSDVQPGTLGRHSALTGAGMAELWGSGDGATGSMIHGAALTGAMMTELRSSERRWSE